MVEIFKKKLYKGGFQTAKDAAEYYDRLSINVFGLKVRSEIMIRLERIHHILNYKCFKCSIQAQTTF